MGPTDCPESSVTTNERCVTSQENEDPNENRCQTSLSVLVNKTPVHVWTANTTHVFFKSATGYKSVRIPRFCDRPTRRRYSVVFLSPRANAQSVPKIHVALHASHAALPRTSFFLPKCSPPPPNAIRISSWRYPPNTKLSPNVQLLSSAAYSQQPTSLQASVVNSQTRYLVSNLPLPEGRAGIVWELSQQ
jgi:hypothetical protein